MEDANMPPMFLENRRFMAFVAGPVIPSKVAYRTLNSEEHIVANSAFLLAKVAVRPRDYLECSSRVWCSGDTSCRYNRAVALENHVVLLRLLLVDARCSPPYAHR